MALISDSPSRGGDTRTGAYWHVMGRSSISLTSSPGANGSVTASGYGGISANVTYTASVSPVTISLGGVLVDANGNPILDGSGNQQILVGQGCKAGLAGIPPGCNVTSWNWSVSGSTFQNWLPQDPGNPKANPPIPANSQASFYDPGPGTQTNATYHWYWNDPKQTPETVSCTAMVTPPTGEGPPFSVTATQKVTVYVPTVIKSINTVGAGYILSSQSGNQTTTSMVATDGGQGFGSTWTAAVSLPAIFGTGGYWGYVQLITAGEYVTLSDGTQLTSTDTTEGEGLDSVFPYMSVTFFNDGRGHSLGDKPSLVGLNVGIASAQMTDSFKTYLMFQAPGPGVEWVPLAESLWITNFNAKIPGSGSWLDFPPAMSVGLVSLGYNFVPQNTFPKWLRIIATGQPFIHN